MPPRKSTKQTKPTAAAVKPDPDPETEQQTPRSRKRAAVADRADETNEEPETPSRSSKRARTKPTSYKQEDEEKEPVEAATTKPKTGKAKTTDDAAAALPPSSKAPRAKRQTPADKAAAAMPLAARSPSSLLKLGAHVSAAGGVHAAVPNAVHIGANAFALFLQSQRRWTNPPLSSETAAAFRSACAEHAYDAASHAVPHGSYLVNLAAADPAKAEQAYALFEDDLKRCAALGIALYNIHPGNTNGLPRAEALARLAAQLDRAHAAVPDGPVTLLENMAAAPEANTLGGRLSDLGAVLAAVKQKEKVGVCIDTCHAFGAGADLASEAGWAAFLRDIDDAVGLDKVRAWHVNDSKAVRGSHRDLHANIGTGFVGLRAFHRLVNERRFHGLPLVLETPCDVKDTETGKSVEDKGVWASEIKLLESLVGMDPDGDEFQRLEAELSDKGREERAKMQAQFDKKAAAAASPKKKRAGGKKRKAESEASDEDD